MPETFLLHNRLGGVVATLKLEGGTYDTTLEPGTPTEAVVYTLPPADGNNGQVLYTDGSGNLDFVTVATASHAMSTHSDEDTYNINTSGTLGCGELTIDSGAGKAIVIKGTSTGNANEAWIGFYDSDGTTRRGYVGDSSVTNDDINIVASTGDLGLSAAGTVILPTGSTIGNLTLANGSITDSGGTISFGNENLSTSGTFGCVSLTALSGGVTLSQTLILYDVIDAAIDTDKFLVLDGSGNVDYRTGANVLSDIGGAAASHAMSTHSDEDTYNISTSGTVGAGNSTLGTIGCNEITVADGHGINLQEDITFTGATTENLIKIPDNLLDALSIQEGLNKYVTFDTVNDEEDIFFYKSVDVLHTATHADDHALEIDTDAAGYGDVKALDIDYITGNITAGEDEGILLLNIDRTLATGGDIFALEVLGTDQVAGSTGIYALKIGPEIGPVHQDSGTFIDPTLATDNHPSNHVAIMADGILANTTAIFTNDNEYIIIGADTAFEDIELIFSTVSSKDIKPTFWYSISGTDTFTQFTPVDGTDGCRHTGVISWDASDLSNHVADDITTKFDIKIIRTKGGSFTTPVLGYAKTAATTEYIWDKNGDVNIRNLVISDGGNIHGEDGLLVAQSGGKLGFYGLATPIALQTGVAVSAAGIHAALVALNLITA